MKTTKNRNLLFLLDLFRREGVLSQADLVKRSGLQASTVSNHVRQLRNLGALLTESKDSPSAEGGRPLERLALNPHFLGVKIQFLESPLEQLLNFQGEHESVPECLQYQNVVLNSKELSEVEAAFHYHLVQGARRHRSLLVFHRSSQGLQGAFGYCGIPEKGFFGKAGFLKGPELSLDLMEALIRWTDPESVALGGIGIHPDNADWLSFRTALSERIFPCHLLHTECEHPELMGATWWEQDRFLSRKLYDLKTA